MRWLRRRPAATTSGTGPTRQDVASAMAHLQDFVATRVGVEAYVEPRTSVTPTTVVLIATTGEWTRRRVRDERAAYELARDLGVPAYDVQKVGYPARMRAWNASRRSNDRGGRPAEG